MRDAETAEAGAGSAEGEAAEGAGAKPGGGATAEGAKARGVRALKALTRMSVRARLTLLVGPPTPPPSNTETYLMVYR